MKLIINIDKDTKNRLCFGVTYQKDIQTVCEALNNSIPLDDLRSEVENFEINGHIRDVECFNAGIRHALTVIDNYRTESKENEE